jgi:hypothetical protein
MSDENHDVLEELGKEDATDTLEYRALLVQYEMATDRLTTEEAKHAVTIFNLAEAQDALSTAQNDSAHYRRLAIDLDESTHIFHGEANIHPIPFSYDQKDCRLHWNEWRNKRLVYDVNAFGFSFEDRTNHMGAFLANMRNRTTLLLQYYHFMGQAFCQYPPCSSHLMTDVGHAQSIPTNTLRAIVCPRCCNILYCSVQCMTHHDRIHGLLCVESIAWDTEVPNSKKRKQPPVHISDDEEKDVELQPTPEPVVPATTTIVTPPPTYVYKGPPKVPAKPVSIPDATTITFPTTTETFVDASTLTWVEEVWDNDGKKYWSASELPDYFFYWQHAQSCYFTKGDTLKRMNSEYGLFIVSKEQDTREREANKQAKAAKEAEGKGKSKGKGKGKGAKGGKGKGKGQ